MSSGVAPAMPPSRSDLRRGLRVTQRLTVGTLVVAIVCISAAIYKLNKVAEVKQQQIAGLDQRLTDLNGQVADRQAKLADLNQAYEKVRAVANAPTERSGIFDQIQPKARAVPVTRENGQEIYDFSVWLDSPENVRSQIAQVIYKFDHPSFIRKEQVSTDPTNGFLVGYRGWGALRLVTIEVRLKNGTAHPYYFDMHQALGW